MLDIWLLCLVPGNVDNSVLVTVTLDGTVSGKDRKGRQAAATCQRLDGSLFPKRARDQLVTPDFT